MPLSPLLSPVPFDAIPGWGSDRHELAYEAFGRCAAMALSRPYRSGALGIRFEDFASAYAEARERPALNADAARDFFERLFAPYRVAADAGQTSGLVTGFYEPVVSASSVPTELFRVPLMRRPADLVDLNDDNRPSDLDPYLAFGRAEAGAIIEYFDRRAIEGGALAGRGLEIAFVNDPIDAFFIHVQGAARLRMTDGSERRITYAAKSGHRFTGPGGVLAELGEIARAQVTMQSIRAWFRANPDRVDEILWRNRSYIFFRDAPVADPALGQVAAAKVPLTPGRSVAVDRAFHTFGTPLFVDAPTLTAFNGAPFRRLMIAQDTGSAIIGSARGDLFAGSGDEAGEIAGVVRHDAAFFVLVPRSAASATNA